MIARQIRQRQVQQVRETEIRQVSEAVGQEAVR